ncbi:MAG: hypothetical protein CK425_04490 [Parachlamydia sp.]|nr:MAG: hypothetical protein CK425_04490 [Parachlamydia sp.]
MELQRIGHLPTQNYDPQGVNTPSSPLECLPEEIWLSIFEKLGESNPSELKKTSLVCRKWHAICEDQALEWIGLFYFPPIIPSTLSCLPWIRSQYKTFKHLDLLKHPPSVFFEQVSTMSCTFISLYNEGNASDKHSLIKLLTFIDKIYKKIHKEILQRGEISLLLAFGESHLLFLDMILKTPSEEQQRTLSISHPSEKSFRFFPQILYQHFVRLQVEIEKKQAEFSLSEEVLAAYLKQERSFAPAAAIIGSKVNRMHDSVKKLTLYEIEMGCDCHIHHILSFLLAEKMDNFPFSSRLVRQRRDLVIQIERIHHGLASKHYSETSHKVEVYWHMAFKTCTAIIKLELRHQNNSTIMIGLYGINTNSRWETVATACSLIPSCTIYYPHEQELRIDPVYTSQGVEIFFPIPEPAQTDSFFQFINHLLKASFHSIPGAQLSAILKSGNFALPDLIQHPEQCIKTLCFNEFFFKTKQVQMKIAAYTLLGLATPKYGLSDYRIKYGSLVPGYSKIQLNNKLKDLTRSLQPLRSLRDMSIYLLIAGLQNQATEALDLIKMLQEDSRMAAHMPGILKMFKEAIASLDGSKKG